MRVRASLLEQFPVLRGTIRTSRSPVLLLLVRIYVNQCTGIIYSEKDETIQVRNEASSSSLPLRKRGIENIEERGVREREKITVSLLFMMRAGPISAH